MKKRTLRFLALSLACFLMVGAAGFAAGSSYTKEILTSYVGVRLVVDGNRIVPKDVNGNIVEPFIYEGTTYLCQSYREIVRNSKNRLCVVRRGVLQ